MAFTSCRQFVTGQVTHMDLSPAPEVWLHFYHCERKRGSVIRPLCWPMTHHPPYYPNRLPLLPRRPQRSMSEQYLKPGGGPRRNRSLPPSLSVLDAFLVVKAAKCWLCWAASCPLWRARVLLILQGVFRSCSLEKDVKGFL